MGTVTDADMGQPLAGARVTLYRMEVGASWPSMIEQFAAVAYDADVTWFAVGPIVTKADGRFTFPAKSPGIYHLEVKAPNYLTARTEEFRLRAGESLTRAVSLRPVPPHLRPGLVTGAVRRVYGPTRLSVRFQGRGQCVDTDWAAAGPPPRPEWWGMSHSPPASTEIPEMGGYDLSTQLRTNAKGRFAFALPPGNCALRFTLPNGRGQEFPDVNIFPGGKVELTVTPGRLPPKPKAVSSPSQPPTGLLQLTILRPDGTPLANTAVLAFPYTVNKAGRIVASDIGFRQVTDARGVVNLSTDPDRQGWWVKAAGFAEGKVPPVKITAGRPARTTMRLPGPTARLVARVRTINGQPVPHAVVAAVRLSVLKGSPGGVSLADTYHDVFWVTYEQLLQWSGRGLIQGSDLPALVRRGHYVALTGARGEGVLPDLEPGTYFTSAAAAGFARESPVRLNIRGRETRREFILRPLARIAGIIRQRDGRPWANVELKVSILGRTGELWWERDQTVQTDAAGRYTLSVADNITRLRFQRNGWVPVDVKPVGLTPGRMKTIDVRLDRGAAVKGTVRPRPGQVLPPGLIVKASQREGQQWVPVAANGTYVLTGLEVGSGWLEVKTGSGRVLAKVDIKIREPRQTLTQDLQVSGRALP
jgi:5-hydroxyisourate hydrolase-like protein (transthyretin family)